MNELLGLFGYEDKVNSTDTENLNLENYTENADGDTSPSADVTGDVKDRKSRLKTSLRRRKLYMYIVFVAILFSFISK